MATPTFTHHVVPGILGDISVDVRAGGRASPRPTVVTLHGFKGFKDWGMWPPLADRLARGGFAAVSLNFSGSGVDDQGVYAYPERFGHNTFSAELDDLRRVLVALYDGGLGVAPPSALGLLGHSRGGGIAILHTAADSRVRALVTWSSISTVERWSSPERKAWRADGSRAFVNQRTKEAWVLFPDVLDDIEHHSAELDIEAAAARIRVPWLLVHGTHDESVNLAEAELLAATGTRPGARFLPIEGAGHTFGAAHPMPDHHPDLDRVFDATLGFFADNLA